MSRPAAQQLLELAPELLQPPHLLQTELRWPAQPGVSALNMALAKLADGQVGLKTSVSTSQLCRGCWAQPRCLLTECDARIAGGAVPQLGLHRHDSWGSTEQALCRCWCLTTWVCQLCCIVAGERVR